MLRLPLSGLRFYATSSGVSTLVLVEHNGKKIAASTLSAITAAKKLGGSVTAFVGGTNAGEVANEISKVEGVNTVLKNESPLLDNSLPEVLSPYLATLQKDKKFTHIVASNSAIGKNVLPRTAALLDVAQISDVIEIKNDNTFVRPFYAGNAIATVSTNDPTKILTVRQTAFEKATSGSSSAKIEDFSAEVKKSERSHFVSSELSTSTRPELTSASKIIAGGRALKSGENFQILYDLADKIGAAVGASRAAVDAGYVSNDLQIGQTGKIVAPELYIAVGISGAIQHLAGMKDSKVIAAINKDPDAPIFQVADYGLVADLFKAIPEMNEKL